MLQLREKKIDVVEKYKTKLVRYIDFQSSFSPKVPTRRLLFVTIRHAWENIRMFQVTKCHRNVFDKNSILNLLNEMRKKSVDFLTKELPLKT